MSEPGFFEILDTTRAMKRLKPDPVPLELLRKVLDAGTKAPSGVNTQPWEFLVVRDPGTKKWIQERYLHFTKERFGALVDSLEGVDTPHARMLRTVIVLDAISLVFDAADAVRFLRCDRAETVPNLEPPLEAIGSRA